MKLMASKVTSMAKDGKKMFKSMLSGSNSGSDRLTEKMNELEIHEGYSTEFESVEKVCARKPGVAPKMWTTEDDDALRRAVEKFGDKNWRAVAEEVPGRNHIQCVQRWKKVLAPGLVKGHWTREEDLALMALIDQNVDAMGSINQVDWTWIAHNVPGRSVKQCRERWFLNLDPSINRGPWTPEEDRLLLELVDRFGPSWSKVSKGIEGRTENSVKTRHQSLLRQQARLRGWTSDEDAKIISEVQILGRNWNVIARKLKGRTGAQVKKRFGVLSHENASLMSKVYAVENSLGIVPNKPHSIASHEGSDTDYMTHSEHPSPHYVHEDIDNSLPDFDVPVATTHTDQLQSIDQTRMQKQESWGFNSLLHDLIRGQEVGEPIPLNSYDQSNRSLQIDSVDLLVEPASINVERDVSSRSLQLDRVFSDETAHTDVIPEIEWNNHASGYSNDTQPYKYNEQYQSNGYNFYNTGHESYQNDYHQNNHEILTYL